MSATSIDASAGPTRSNGVEGLTISQLALRDFEPLVYLRHPEVMLGGKRALPDLLLVATLEAKRHDCIGVDATVRASPYIGGLK